MAPDKIKSKDLSYESTLPPFLQRLHDQKAGRGDQDRHEQQIARPKRAKTHDDEDDPTVVDESGETVSMAELKKMESRGEGADGDGIVTGELKDDGELLASGALPDEDARQKADQKVTDGAATKKRKVAKVVGDDDEGQVEDGAKKKDGEQGEPATKKPAKKAKKSKPIKLAFNDDEG
ncbi:uncharacterized protein LTR77_007214 [Saxophila tyrrhenica]|uniref:DUF4604 domain-containing protein n=1 Tax=Saxophila tyrrhenica TaxID=1690608 RepID=A0AAV9P848_9PEZI|nr:hypothetical protein LTR77_007214 [Saxophila tyrrhenica]